MQSITTISQKGQIVVPKKIRDQLKLKASDLLSVSLEKNTIIVTPLSSSDEVFGMFKAKAPITKKDIKQAYQAKARKKSQ